MSRPATALLATTAAALLGTGCGAVRVEPPDISRPFSTAGKAQREFPAAGLTFEAPADWAFDEGEGPLVASTSSGSATIAIWRYVRTEPLPRTQDELDEAGRALADAARTRDESFQLRESERVRIDGARGVQLVGIQRVAGQERQVRSVHLYAKGAEVVVDQYAAPRDFATVDRSIFQPLLRSLKIDPPRS